ncbi:MAG: hypothetical protein RSE41_03970 [Clostridia bacterium]
MLDVSNKDIKKIEHNTTLGFSEITRCAKDIETTSTVYLGINYNIEVRKISMFNTSNETRQIDITTYIEPALTDYMTQIVHPSFNNLQIETEYNKDLDVLIASKRLKNETDKNIYLYAKLIGIDLNKQMETEKIKLDKLDPSMYDNNIAKYPLWPILSYKANVILTPYERQEFYYVIGVSDNVYDIKNAIVNMDKDMLDKEFNLACNLSTIVSRYLKLEDAKVFIYNNLLKELLFNKKKIDDKFFGYNLDQSMLWKYGISGDFPILLITINGIENINLINEVISFMDYVKNRKIDIDIIVLSSDNKYSEKVYIALHKNITNTNYMDYTKGNIYLFNKDKLNKDELDLFDFISNIKIDNLDVFLTEKEKLRGSKDE